MRISLGTVELADADKKAVSKAVTGKSYATRDQLREWLLGVVQHAIDEAVNPTPQGPDAAHLAAEPATAPPNAGDLPEPAGATVPAT